MKRIVEKIISIYRIIFSNEYAIYTTEIKNGERVVGCCLISDNSDYVFIKTIIDFNELYIKDEKLDSNENKN